MEDSSLNLTTARRLEETSALQPDSAREHDLGSLCFSYGRLMHRGLLYCATSVSWWLFQQGTKDGTSHVLCVSWLLDTVAQDDWLVQRLELSHAFHGNSKGFFAVATDARLWEASWSRSSEAY